MIEYNKDEVLCKLINNIGLQSIPIRQVYEEALLYQYGNIPYIIKENEVKRLMINLLRHKYTNYDKGLFFIKKMGNMSPDYRVYKNAVINEISSKYPILSDECLNHIEYVNMVNKISERA